MTFASSPRIAYSGGAPDDTTAAAKPAQAKGKLPAILVVHENRGLNPHIEDIARRLALLNFIAFAPDGLAPQGGYPGDEEKAAAALAWRRTVEFFDKNLRG